MTKTATKEPLPADGNRRTKDRLLLLLKTRGPMTTKALAEVLEISVPAVRVHLKSLGAAVAAENVSGGVGRPAQTWKLTENAAENFPDTHSELTIRILDSIEATLGEAGLNAVIADRYRADERRYHRALSGIDSLPRRLRRLVQIRSDEGYMAELEKSADGWLLVENHCPICAAAQRCQGFCRNELDLFNSVLGQEALVSRDEYLLDGGRRCAYRIVRT